MNRLIVILTYQLLNITLLYIHPKFSKISLRMLKHVAKIDKNIKTHFISSNKYFIKHNIYPKRNKMKHILKPETKESPYYIRKGKVIDI